jgi:outer membrane protein assembly factor BamD
MTIRFKTILTAILIAVPTACASASAGANKVDANTLWQQANDKLKAHKWTDAQQLFERFTLEFPTDTRYQEARFRIGEAHLGMKEYITAATEFARLAADFPNGAFADDAQFNVCDSYRHLSPDIELDQQYTQSAIEQCQILVAYFGQSEYVPRATQIVAELTDKLAHKLYATGDYYMRRKANDSAILYYELTVKTYPMSQWAPRALARMIDAYRNLGYDTELNATRARLLKDYPESPEAKMKPDSVGKR